ncbi:hypothetical protein MES5069_310026 [Mesorhizobium escarrei]|uniref:Tn3 transposase DDE domain-containing protein n=1 Tax=Mesorhizobium escarrei TaxID=666018 RepID=A0ABN8JYK9_9HYPH|nr:hypothetical protein MES5069_310026 [Mesorhizobium escarrei]
MCSPVRRSIRAGPSRCATRWLATVAGTVARSLADEVRGARHRNGARAPEPSADPDTGDRLEPIEHQYDELIKYAAALQHRTADAESILRRFARASVQRPSYKALAQLGKAIKTIFLTAISARKPSGAKSTKCRLAVNSENAVVRSGLAVDCESGVARILHFNCNRISVKVMNPFNFINRNSACSGAELPGEATGIFVLEENIGPVRCAVSKHDGPTFDEFDLAKLPLFRNVVDLQRQPSDPGS